MQDFQLNIDEFLFGDDNEDKVQERIGRLKQIIEVFEKSSHKIHMEKPNQEEHDKDANKKPELLDSTIDDKNKVEKDSKKVDPKQAKQQSELT